MNWNEFPRWGWAVVLVVNAFGYWGMWSLNKKYTSREECGARHSKDSEALKGVDKALTSMEGRHTELEARLDNLPPLDSVHGIQLVVAELRGEMRTQGAEIRGLREILSRMENNLTLLMRGHIRTE